MVRKEVLFFMLISFFVTTLWRFIFLYFHVLFHNSCFVCSNCSYFDRAVEEGKKEIRGRIWRSFEGIGNELRWRDYVIANV